MAILEKSILVSVGNNKDSYFETLGYVIPKYIDKQHRLKVRKGTKIEIRVSDLPINSQLKLTKICDFCGEKCTLQSYQNIISKRDNEGKDKCSKCAKKQSGNTRYNNCPINKSLAFVYPEITKQFHKSKNELSPEEIYSKSTRIVWWSCHLNPEHDYEMSVVAKTNNNAGCPYCSGHRVNHTNSLSITHYDLSKEWDFQKNKLTPNEVTSGSGIYAWWVCSNKKCNHKWKARIADRVNSRGCPQCNISNGEKKILDYLIANGVPFIQQFTFDDLYGVGGGLLKFDFAILNRNGDLNCLIEYDGEFHYHKLFENDNHEIIKTHDNYKNKYCEKNFIKLIRIPYWEFNNIVSIIKKVCID